MDFNTTHIPSRVLTLALKILIVQTWFQFQDTSLHSYNYSRESVLCLIFACLCQINTDQVTISIIEGLAFGLHAWTLYKVRLLHFFMLFREWQSFRQSMPFSRVDSNGIVDKFPNSLCDVFDLWFILHKSYFDGLLTKL